MASDNTLAARTCPAGVEALSLGSRGAALIQDWPADGAPPAPRGRSGGPAPGRAAGGDGGDLPEAAHERREPGAPGVPVPAAGSDDQPAGSRLVRRYHLHPCFRGLFLLGSGDRLGQPLRARLAVVEHDGQRVLRRGARRGPAPGHTPDIFNTDQVAQFTSAAFTGRVLAAGARCSMDGRAPMRSGLERQPFAARPALVLDPNSRPLVDRHGATLAVGVGPGW